MFPTGPSAAFPPSSAASAIAATAMHIIADIAIRPTIFKLRLIAPLSDCSASPAHATRAPQFPRPVVERLLRFPSSPSQIHRLFVSSPLPRPHLPSPVHPSESPRVHP